MKMTSHFSTFFVVLIIALSDVMRAEAEDAALQVVIETAILAPDPQAGMKSRQVMRVDFDAREIRSAFETGKTDFFGIQLGSVRNNFKVTPISLSSDKVVFNVTGETASGTGIIPNINYSFDLELDRNATVKITGCHDAYPAYTIFVEGKRVYDFRHKSIDLLKLFGACDVEVRE